MKASCPSCQSTETVSGELRTDASGHDVGHVGFFLPSTRGRFFLVSEPCVYPDTATTVCLQCGLLWSQVDPKEIRRLHEKYGG
jgi:hypothetical protein